MRIAVVLYGVTGNAPGPPNDFECAAAAVGAAICGHGQVLSDVVGPVGMAGVIEGERVAKPRVAAPTHQIPGAVCFSLGVTSRAQTRLPGRNISSSVDSSKEVFEVGNRVRWLQVLIILSALLGVLAVQSTRSRQGVLTAASGMRTMT